MCYGLGLRCVLSPGPQSLSCLAGGADGRLENFWLVIYREEMGYAREPCRLYLHRCSPRFLRSDCSPSGHRQLSIPAPHCNASPPPPYMWDCDFGNRSQNKPSSLESFLSGKTEGTNTSIKDHGRTNPNPYHSQNEFHFIWDRTLINEHYLKKIKEQIYDPELSKAIFIFYPDTHCTDTFKFYANIYKQNWKKMIEKTWQSSMKDLPWIKCYLLLHN